MNTINRSLLALALLGGFMPARAMESQDPNNNNNKQLSLKLIIPENAQGVDRNIGNLETFPNDVIFEICSQLIKEAKTTEEAYRTIHLLSLINKYFYAVARELYDHKSNIELELQEYDNKLRELERKKFMLSGQPILFNAIEMQDSKWLEKMVPRLRKNMSRVLSEDYLWQSPLSRLVTKAFSKYSDEQAYDLACLFLKNGAKIINQLPLLFAFIENKLRCAALFAGGTSCKSIQAIFENPNSVKLINDSSSMEHFKAFLKEHHKCDSCKFE